MGAKRMIDYMKFWLAKEAVDAAFGLLILVIAFVIVLRQTK